MGSRESTSDREALFQAFFNQSAVGMAQLDLSGRWMRVNRKLGDMVGYTPEEMLGMSYQDITHPGDLDSDLSYMRRLIAGDIPTCIFEKRYICKDGKEVWANVTVSLEREAKTGKPRWFVAIIQEITARKAAEHALQDKETFLQSIYQGVEEAIFVVDVQAAGRFAFAGFNPAYIRLVKSFGVDPVRLQTEGLDYMRTLFPEEVVEGVRSNYQRCAETGTAMEYEEQAVLEGKPTYWVTRLTPLPDPSGRIYRIVGTSTNVTAQKENLDRIRRTEDHLRQAQKMEAVGRLAGGIAHDFNNLLTAINGYGDLLLAGISEGQPQYEYVREIRNAGERAASLTHQLLAFSRKQVLAPKEVGLNAVVADMVSMLNRLIGDEITLETRLAPDLPPILADRGQIEQVIMNLALNARDAMPSGGRLSLETSAASFKRDALGPDLPAAAGSFACLSVSDSGKGMDEATRLRIFEPFFTTKPAGQGTGLGLSMVYGIVTQSGGFIKVESTPGQGSTFQVHLPLAPQEAVPAAAPLSEGGIAALGHETVLVAEDESALRKLIVRILSDRGYTVLAAADGQEALDLAAGFAGPIHLLLTDVVMPRMGGRELGEALRKQRPEIGLIYMSGYTDDTMVRHGIQESKADFIQKPFTPASLLALIRQALDSKSSPFLQKNAGGPSNPRPRAM